MRRIQVTAHRWRQSKPMFHSPTMGRFGGGWHYRLGIAIGGTTVLIELIWGLIAIRIMDRP